jgi:hypothetical protein
MDQPVCVFLIFLFFMDIKMVFYLISREDEFNSSEKLGGFSWINWCVSFLFFVFHRYLCVLLS